MRQNLILDLETLQTQLNENEIKYKESTKKIESVAKNEWIEKINFLRNEIDDERERTAIIISDLNNKITTLENRPIDEPNYNENKFDLIRLEEKNADLKKEIEEYKLLISALGQENQALNIKIKTLEERNLETVEMLESKKEALGDVTNALKDIQEEKALLNNELIALKAIPLDDKCRGNSLFAEVEDNRQALMKTISQLKSKLRESKVMLTSKNEEISKLKIDNSRLHHQIQKGDGVLKPEQVQLVEAYKVRINELEFLVNKMEKQLNPSTLPTNESHRIEWISDALDQTRRELHEVQQEFNKISQQRVLDVQNIADLKNEISSLKINYDLQIKKWEANNLEKKNELADTQHSKLINEEGLKVPNKQMKAVRFASDV